MAGDIREARRLCAEAKEAGRVMTAGSGYGDPQGADATLAHAEGEWERSFALRAQAREHGVRVGSRLMQSNTCMHLATVHMLRGDHGRAEPMLHEALTLALDGNAVVHELVFRRQWILLCADTGRISEARVHLARCQEILSVGEDWRGRGGQIVLAEAVVLAAEGNLRDAAPLLEKALQIFRRLGLPWEEAEALHRWGTALVNGGERKRGLETLDAAIAIYRRIGAGAPWIERVLADKLRAQGTPSGEVQRSIDIVAASIGAKRPDLRAQAAPDGTVTLLFSDMEGFTAMTERLGDLAARKVIAQHNRIVRAQLAAHGGFEVELQGDGFLLAFPSARRGLRCAIAIQRDLAAYSAAHPEQPIRVRIGLHTGEALREADKFFGKTVILAARIAAQATGGEILVSALVKELTQSAGDIRFDASRDVALKGLSGTYALHPVAWSETGA
jgi:class 3 adenylate cyclase